MQLIQRMHEKMCFSHSWISIWIHTPLCNWSQQAQIRGTALFDQSLSLALHPLAFNTGLPHIYTLRLHSGEKNQASFARSSGAAH